MAHWIEESNQFVEMEELLALQNKQRICRLAASEGDIATLRAASTATPLNTVLDHMRLTLLHVASREGQAAVVKMLLDMFREDEAFEVFLHAVDNDRMTAIDYAIEQRHDAIAEVLVERGAGLEGVWLKDRLVEAVTSGEVQEVQRLMRFAKDSTVAVHSTDKEGRSLVHLALQQSECRSELVEMLLGFGADLNGVDFYGNDVVSEAVALGDPKIDAIFQEDGVDLDRIRRDSLDGLPTAEQDAGQPEVASN